MSTEFDAKQLFGRYGGPASVAERFSDRNTCERVREVWQNLYGKPNTPVSPGEYPGDYYSFKIDRGGDNATERLLIWREGGFKYNDCTIEYWAVDKNDLEETYRLLHGLGYDVVEPLAEDPRILPHKDPSARALLATSSGKLLGVIINPPYPLL